ncbi:MAG: tyrosine--tRNA ligase [Proteobacteria bacterium]|nr:tyrosine--tRNA ligase [Pseudomonadota bacterium]
MNFKSSFLQEFFLRGFLAQSTNPERLDENLTNQNICAYIGFDCTAKSLHIGSLIQIMILRLLQKHNHTPIVLLGGGTTKIGDPSGKDESRQILNSNQIENNLLGIKKTLEKFLNINNKNLLILNNDEWLKNLNYIDFLRDIGKHFSINRMLSFESVKLRLDREQPLSFIEFNYMILQAYDFYHLFRNHNCKLQIGGSDQWGNIINGVELIRRLNHQNDINDLNKIECFGLTTPLLTTHDGKKMGKTSDGAIWLDESMLSPFDYFQYFRNTHDADVIKFLKLFTDLPLEYISNLEKLDGFEINKAKEILAFEATKICHGEQVANDVLNKAREIFIQKNSNSFEEKILKLKINNHDNSLSIKLIDIIFEIGATESKSDAKRLIEGKAIKINNEIVNNTNISYHNPQYFDLSIGKKKFYKIIIS